MLKNVLNEIKDRTQKLHKEDLLNFDGKPQERELFGDPCTDRIIC
jgi:hypothetical protein